MKVKTKTVEQQLADSERDRQRALGAQAALREELDRTKATLADREERLTATANRLDIARQQLSEATKRAEHAESVESAAFVECRLLERKVAAYEGRFAMLRDMGTIPTEAALTDGATPVEPGFGTLPYGWRP